MTDGEDRSSGGPPDDDSLESADEEPEPTTSQRDAIEAVWFLREEIALGSVSILAMIAIAVGLMITTGVIDVPGDVSPTASLAVGVAAMLIGFAATVFLWTSWGPSASPE